MRLPGWLRWRHVPPPPRRHKAMYCILFENSRKIGTIVKKKYWKFYTIRFRKKLEGQREAAKGEL